MKVGHIIPYLSDCRSLLDFGCGDLSLVSGLKKILPDLRITGVDIVDFGIRPNGILFTKYNGEKLPFKNNSFDVVIAYHVLHHTDDPQKLFAECARVVRKKILLVEPIPRVSFERPFMMILDWVFNVWKNKTIRMPFAFLSESIWYKLFHLHHLGVVVNKDIEPFPRWLPTGRSHLFVLHKNPKK